MHICFRWSDHTVQEVGVSRTCVGAKGVDALYWWEEEDMIRWKRKKSEATQSCLTLCDPMDCSLPGSSVHGIFNARVLEWVAIYFSRGSSRPRDWIPVSCIAGRRFIVWATREAKIKNDNGKFGKPYREAEIWCGIRNKWSFPGGSAGKESVFKARDLGLIPWLERYPGEGNGTHSSMLAWKISWTEESGRL